MIKRILVALSGTPFTPVAVQHGIDLARRHGATLTGVTIVDTDRLSNLGPIPIGGGAAARELAEQRLRVTAEHVEEEIAAFSAACREADIPHDVLRERGDTLDTLVAAWRYHDFTVVGIRGFFEYGVIENPHDEVLRLITEGVRPIVAVAPTYHKIRRVVIAYNGTRVAAKAMKQFIQFRAWPEASIVIACFEKKREKEADTFLADAVAYVQSHGFSVEARYEPTDPREGLPALVREVGGDMVVMGLAARAKLFKLIVGDTVGHMLEKSDVPLFLTQ